MKETLAGERRLGQPPWPLTSRPTGRSAAAERPGGRTVRARRRSAAAGRRGGGERYVPPRASGFREVGRAGIEPATLGLRGPSQRPDALGLALCDRAKRGSTAGVAADLLPRALPRLDLLPNCYPERVGFCQPTKKPSRDCHRRGHGHTGGPACQHQILPPQSLSASSAARRSTKPSGATRAGS